jgi:hypothetical protein
MRLFAIVGRVPALAVQKTVPVSKIKLQLGLIFGIGIRIEFYLLPGSWIHFYCAIGIGTRTKIHVFERKT